MTTKATEPGEFGPRIEAKLRGLLEKIVNSGSIESLDALISLMQMLLPVGHPLISEAESALAKLRAAKVARMEGNLETQLGARDRFPRPKG